MTASEKTGLGRREWLVAALGAGAVRNAGGQQPADQSLEELAAARQAVAENLKTIAQFPLPMATEPAATFKA